MNGPDRLPYRATLFAELLASPAAGAAARDPNRALLASMVAGQATGNGCLPGDFGLGAAACRHLLATYFPGCDVALTQREVESIPE